VFEEEGHVTGVAKDKLTKHNMTCIAPLNTESFAKQALARLLNRLYTMRTAHLAALELSNLCITRSQLLQLSCQVLNRHLEIHMLLLLALPARQ
jgi:hypothetical protein